MAVFRNAVKTNVPQSATSVEIKGPDKGSGGWIIVNDSLADLYLAAGTDAASITNFTWKVAPGGNVQEGVGNFLYIGAVQGIWSGAGAGAARVTVFGV